MSAYVLAVLAAGMPERELAAGFEEEGVPLVVEYREGEARALAGEAAGRSPLGLGIGSDARSLVLVLATRPGRPYLSGEPSEARAFGRAAARLAVGRPLGRDSISPSGPWRSRAA